MTFARNIIGNIVGTTLVIMKAVWTCTNVGYFQEFYALCSKQSRPVCAVPVVLYTVLGLMINVCSTVNSDSKACVCCLLATTLFIHCQSDDKSLKLCAVCCRAILVT